MHREGNKGQQELQNERFDKSFHQCTNQPGVSISFFNRRTSSYDNWSERIQASGLLVSIAAVVRVITQCLREKRCVMTLITAAKETRGLFNKKIVTKRALLLKTHFSTNQHTNLF